MYASSQFKMYSFHDGSSGRQQIMNHPNMEVFSQIRALPPRSQSCQLLLEKADFIIASSSCWNKQLCTSLSCFPVFVLCCSVVIFSLSHEKFSFSSFILTWIHISELDDGAPHRYGAVLQGRGNETHLCLPNSHCTTQLYSYTTCWDCWWKMHKASVASA